MLSTAINKTEKIADDLYMITETGSVHCYLMLGTERGLLFDVGYGYEDFMPIIQSITNLPIVAVLSHGDPDHALGNICYPELYLHELDYGKLLQNDNPEMRKMAVEHRYEKMPEMRKLIDLEKYCSIRVNEKRPKFIRDGYVFHLGNKDLQVIHIPGHSYGSIALYDAQEKRLFTGDMVVDYNIYYFNSSDEQAPFLVAKRSWQKIQNMREQIQAIYPAHGPVPITMECVDNLVTCMSGEFMENYSKDKEIQTFIGTAYQHRYKTVNLLYSKERLEEYLDMENVNI